MVFLKRKQRQINEVCLSHKVGILTCIILHNMFSNSYQNGPFLQVWDAKVNVDKNLFYKQLFRVQQNATSKYFDKQAKNYVYSLSGQNSRLVMPAEDNKVLSLHQRYLILQIFIPISQHWSLQLGLSDLSGVRRRINFTTAQGKEQIKYFSFRYPLMDLVRGNWMFLAIDIHSFMGVFSNQVFRSLDQISLGSNCRVRRIFTMRQFVEWEIPKHYWMSSEIPQQQLELIQFKDDQKGDMARINRQLTEVTSSPKKMRSKKEYINGEESKKMAIQLSQKSGLMRSGAIIEEARKRINSLEKQEEQILSKSREYDKLKPKANLQRQQNPFVKQKLEPSLIKPIKPNRTKLPIIEKSFKEDLALSHDWQESNDSKPQIANHSPKKYQSILEDKWSDNEEDFKEPTIAQVNHVTGNFPSTTITKANNREVTMQKNSSVEMELIYDEMVGCYYHPETNSYYELKQ